MKTRNKFITIGVCIVIVIAVLIANVSRRINTEEDNIGEEETIKENIKGNIISRAEAYRLLSYLEYDKASREALEIGINYFDKDLSTWYDSYVNAVWKMGLIDGNINESPMEALTIGEGKVLVDKLIRMNPLLQGVYANLSFDFLKAEEEMQIPQFLELYKALLELTPNEEQLVKHELIFILDREISEDGKDRIVTDQGRYYYQGARDYERFFNPESDRSYDILSGEELINRFSSKGVEALTCKNEIVYINRIYKDKITIHNVWIKQGKDANVEVYINGIDKKLQTQYKLSQEIEKVIGDIHIENERVVGISVKPDMIQGKVLVADQDFIEIEGYGRVPIDKDYKIYKVYDELSMEQTNSILVGYDITDFVVSEGRISAALIRESIKAENIRVLLHTTGFKDIYHSKVEFGATTDYIVRVDENETRYSADETITLEPGDKMLSAGRVIIEPVLEEGKIRLLSVERSTGNPRYRGRIEIAQVDKGLLLVNELTLEEYLYAVIPSEMPTYYGLESLKVQAVCARSYAYRQLVSNSLSGYGAHVDDSVSYQVYNNIEENEDSILAVKDTYGKVAEYKGDVITAYYFSTSCGHTTGVEHVWANGTAIPYLTGRPLDIEGDSEQASSKQATDSIYNDLTKEENFRSFIMDKEYSTHDSGFNWYRWNVTIDVKDIKKNIDDKLSQRYKANPDLIKTLTSGDSKDSKAVYESIPVTTVGDIVEISVATRGVGGIIYELIIKGTKNTIKVQTEYNIRALLSPANDMVFRLDEKGVKDISLLPSAFFVLDHNIEDNKLASVTITGGGYGHGVGMSQNGVKSLSDTGKKYEDIIKYFYKGTEIGFIYD